MAIINDRITRVQFLLGNRTDINERIIEWLVDAYLELGSSVPFTEMEASWDDTFVVGQDTYLYPNTGATTIVARAIKSIVGFSAAGQPYPIRKQDIRIVERMQTQSNGRPAIWAPFNTQIIVRPVPSVAEDFRIKYWLKPVIQVNPADTALLMPDDWLTVLDHLAAMMGHAALGEEEKASQLNILLHGDPRHADRPGWIQKKILRNAAENVVSDYTLNPHVRKYCH